MKEDVGVQASQAGMSRPGSSSGNLTQGFSGLSQDGLSMPGDFEFKSQTSMQSQSALLDSHFNAAQVLPSHSKLLAS